MAGRKLAVFLIFVGAGIGVSYWMPLSTLPTSVVPEQASTNSNPYSLSGLLRQSAVHLEVGNWQAAEASLEAAKALDPNEKTVNYNQALLAYRRGQKQEALALLDALVTDDLDLQARTHYFRGRLSFELGDLEGESQGLREARALQLHHPEYPYALSQVERRADTPDSIREVGRLLKESLEIWPENLRFRVEWVQWALEFGDSTEKEKAVNLLKSLRRQSVEERFNSLVDSGLDQYAEDGARVPIPLRRAFNLLRPTKAYQLASAKLESRLELAPRREPVETILSLPPVREPEVRFSSSDFSPWSGSEIAIVDASLVQDLPTESDAEVPSFFMLLTEDALFRMPLDSPIAEKVGDLSSRPLSLEVLEVSGDGVMELIVLYEKGLAQWVREGEHWREIPILWKGNALQDLTPLDFEHDGDLDLVLTTSEGTAYLITHQGEAGWSVPQSLAWPVHGKVVSVDLDHDFDQDLVVFGELGLSIGLNEREGDYAWLDSMALPRPINSVAAINLQGDNDFSLVLGTAEGLYFLRGNREESWSTAEVSYPTSGSILEVQTEDLDLDGDDDLWVTSQQTDGLLRTPWFQREGGIFVEGEPLAAASSPDNSGGLLAVDFGEDRDADLLVWQGSSLQKAENTGAEDQGSIRLRLQGLAAKVPLDGRGVRVEWTVGGREFRRQIDQPQVVLGLGNHAPEMVEITWPNGISEYLFEPAPGSSHTIQQLLRIEGSCPFLYASDGSGEPRFVTDILSLSPVGMVMAPNRYVAADPEEYLRLPTWVKPNTEGITLKVTEELREVAYLDQFEIVVVDTPPDISAFNGEKWIEGKVEGLALRLLGPLQPPTTVRTEDGTDVTELVSQWDQRYLTPFEKGRRYQGAVEAHALEITLPEDLITAMNPSLVMVGWLHWGNTSTNVARSQDPQGRPLFPRLEVPQEGGGWREVPVEVGLPAGKTKPVVVELQNHLNRQDPRIRIRTDFEVYWDWIAVAEGIGVKDTPHRVQHLAAQEARLEFGGFSAWYREAENGPYLFDYSDRRPVPWRTMADGGEMALSWQEHEGFYTNFGDVSDLVEKLDERLVVMGAGDELSMVFPTETLPPLASGWQRTYFLHSEGWEKDGDPNVSCSQTVAPLPSRTLLTDPCAGVEALKNSKEDDRRRWVSRSRLRNRVASGP